MQMFKRIVPVLVLALVLTACGGGGAAGGGGSMTDAAKQFFESTFKAEKDNLLAVVCEAGKTAAEAGLAAMGQMASSGATFDFSAMKYEIANESGDNGTVKVSGKLKVTVAGQTQELDLAQAGAQLAELPMKKEGGNWKVCPVAP